MLHSCCEAPERYKWTRWHNDKPVYGAVHCENCGATAKFDIIYVLATPNGGWTKEPYDIEGETQ